MASSIEALAGEFWPEDIDDSGRSEATWRLMAYLESFMGDLSRHGLQFALAPDPPTTLFDQALLAMPQGVCPIRWGRIGRAVMFGNREDFQAAVSAVFDLRAENVHVIVAEPGVSESWLERMLLSDEIPGYPFVHLIFDWDSLVDVRTGGG